MKACLINVNHCNVTEAVYKGQEPWCFLRSATRTSVKEPLVFLSFVFYTVVCVVLGYGVMSLDSENGCHYRILTLLRIVKGVSKYIVIEKRSIQQNNPTVLLCALKTVT